MHESIEQFWKSHTGLLWSAIFAGPLALAVDMAASYPAVRRECVSGHHWIVHVISACAWGLTAIGIANALWAIRQLPSEASKEGGRIMDRSLFLANLALGLSVGFAFVVLALAIPKWFLSPCW